MERKTDRVYLEDVAMIPEWYDTKYGDMRVWNLDAHKVEKLTGYKIPPLTRVVENSAGRTLLLKRGLAGNKFLPRVRGTARNLIFANKDLFSVRDFISEAVALSGADHFKMREAYSKHRGKESVYGMQTHYLGVTRYWDSINNIWIAKVVEPKKIEDGHAETLVQPDTCLASSVSMRIVLRHFAERGLLPPEVILMTAAGSLVGLSRFYEEALKLGVKKVIAIFSQALLGITMTDGIVTPPETDLPLLHPQTICSRRFIRDALDYFCIDGIDKLPCCVGDAGDRQKNPASVREYLLGTLVEMYQADINPRHPRWDWSLTCEKDYQQGASAKLKTGLWEELDNRSDKFHPHWEEAREKANMTEGEERQNKLDWIEKEISFYKNAWAFFRNAT